MRKINLSRLFFPKKEANSPEDLTRSFVVFSPKREINQNEFVKWYSEIVYLYHPINNQFYNYE